MVFLEQSLLQKATVHILLRSEMSFLCLPSYCLHLAKNVLFPTTPIPNPPTLTHVFKLYDLCLFQGI